MTQIIDKIIKELNSYIISSRQSVYNFDKSFLVFGATIEESKQFKAYKRVTYRLILVKPKGEHQEIYSDSESGNFSSESDKKRTYETLNHRFMEKLFYMIRYEFDKLLKGDWT